MSACAEVKVPPGQATHVAVLYRVLLHVVPAGHDNAIVWTALGMLPSTEASVPVKT